VIDPRSVSFGRRAAAYDETRPSYPEEAIEIVVDGLQLGPDAVVVDLAAGTGKLTRLLAARFANLTAVDPSEGMRASLRRSLPEIEVLAGTAESIPLADRSVDAVFVGEAFHWFDPERAVAEIGRVLADRGGLALIRNREAFSAESNPWLAEFGRLIEPAIRRAGPHPNERGSWSSELEAIGGLEPAQRAEIAHVHRLDRDRFVELISTWSFVANLPEDERTDLLGQIEALLGDQDSVELDYVTEVIWSRRRSASKPG
jgi:SAM-dependent methyltransferase